jgi:hypothetical protein
MWPASRRAIFVGLGFKQGNKMSKLATLLIPMLSACLLASASASAQQRTFFDALGLRESNGDYSTVNALGYLGKYQFGELALTDLGYYTADGTPDNDWIGVWTGKNNVHSKSAFLADHAGQERAMLEWASHLWRSAMHPDFRLDKFVGCTIGAITITPAGIVAGAHLVGMFGVKSFLESGGANDPLDPIGTPVSDYIRNYGRYEIPEATGSEWKLVQCGKGMSASSD